MDRQAVLWLLVLCFGCLLWLRVDLQNAEIRYELHHFLVDNQTGAKIEPRQLIELGKILREPANYTNETSAIDRLYDRTHQTNLVEGFPMYYAYSEGHDLEVSAWPVSNRTLCDQQLEWLDRQFDLHPNYQLLRGRLARELAYLVDSFGKLESGALSGLNTWPGSYSQCRRATLDGGRIRTRYCTAMMRFGSWPRDERAEPKSRLNVGACLPEACDTSSLADQRHRIESLVKLELPAFYRENLELAELYCLPDERSPLRRIPTAGWMFLAFCAVWSTCILTATLADIHFSKLKSSIDLQLNEVKVAKPLDRLFEQQKQGQSQKVEDRVWHRLSLIRVWREFRADPLGESMKRTELESVQVRFDMRSVNCVKIFMTIGVVFFHSVFLVSMKARSIEQKIEFNRLASWRLVFSLGRAVDGFFLFFGMLMAYNMLKREPEKRLGNPLVWLKLNAQRLIRVCPLYTFTYVFARSIEPYLGDGPWWDYGTSRYSIRGLCTRNNWIQAVPYFGNWNETPAATCVPPSWFIISYVQLALAMPLITFLIHRLPNHASRLLLLAFLFLVSGLEVLLKMLKQTTLKPEAYTLYGGFLLALLEKYESTGTMSTLGRIGCTATGCYLGYLLRQYETGQIQRWPGWLTSRTTLCLASALQLVVVVLPMIGFLLTRDQDSTTEQFLAGYFVTMLLWTCTLCVQTICGLTVYNRTALVQFMSHRCWQTLNKLGFAIYLVHWSVMVCSLQQYDEAAPYGFTDEFHTLFAKSMCITVPVSLALHILLEAPMTRLVKPYLEPARQRAAANQ